MRIFGAKARGTLPGHFRSGEWARVAEVVFVIPNLVSGERVEPRLCWGVVFPDGTMDYWPVSDAYEVRPTL